MPITITDEEYQELMRVKRLAENVKNKITELKKHIDIVIENQLSGGKYSKSDDSKCLTAWKLEIKYLESLYNEKP